MTVDSVNPLGTVHKAMGAKRAQAVPLTEQRDSVTLSEEVRASQEVRDAIELVKSLPDVRADRVAELKSKIHDPAYLSNSAIYDLVAERIVNQLLG